MSDKVLIWVSPKFQTMIKTMAAQNNKTVIQLTDDIAIQSNSIEKLCYETKERMKRPRYDFP